ncbi:MAG TPA: response regulator [Thermoanaerobaculia bacterium]|nr:response regulator [Thermoanaerobaculia bacterium]
MRIAAEKRPSRPRLLVVDEDSLFRWSLREKFAAAGWDVVDAGAGFPALEACAGRDVELALVAVTLPDLDGAALGARLSAIHPSCRVVLMSSAEPPDVLASTPAGLPVLEKPFDLDELVARAERDLAETG